MFKIIALFLLMILGTSAYALDLNEAKATGLVGERNDGYVGYVQSPNDEVKALVKSVNNKRKQFFEETSKKSGASPAQVAARFYQRAVKETQKGHFVQDGKGNWVKKQ